ncbi:rab11 family-interacting protein 1 isoform X2 [Nannospalax galili]|nr:rab11 family-interacting protein 1 isoform X2 [Nannospalax galili]
MRNNMTASMFDLSMKDKSRNPFGKLKDKIKGKNKDSASDATSAVVPSTTPSVDSDDESFSKDKKKKSKIKTLFSKSNLQKTPLSQSMSVLPTSKPDKVLLRPGDFLSRWDDDDNEDESSSASDVMTHKRTASADHKQLNQINFSLPKKEGLSFLGGLRAKSDSLSRSNVCINGNHVYVEQSEARRETKDSSPSDSPSPQGFRKKHLFSSTEDLAARPPKEPGEGGASPDRWKSDPSTKSMSLPSYRPLAGGDIRENMAPENREATKETKDSKKQESKKSSLLSLVTGKKDAAKDSEGESLPTVLEKEKAGSLAEAQLRKEDLAGRSEKDTASVASRQGSSPDRFEDVCMSGPEAGLASKPELKPPVPAARTLQTKAVKPRLQVSPEAQPKARLPSPDSALLFAALLSGSAQAPVISDLRCNSEAQSSESLSVFSFPSPTAAPISTSTPVEHWPPTGRDEACSEECSSLLKAVSQKESLTPAPNTGSALGSFCKQLPIPLQKGTEESSGGEPRETDSGNEASSDESGRYLMGQQEELWVPSPEQHWVPSPEEGEGVASALLLKGSGITSLAEKPPTGGNMNSEVQPRSFMENNVSNGGMTSAVKEATPPLEEEGAVPPFDSIVQKHEEMDLNASGGQKKAKKRVSFSKQLFVEGEAGKSPGPGAEDSQHLMQEGAAAAGAVSSATFPASPHTEGTEKELVTTDAQPTIRSLEESFAEGPSPARGTQLFRMEEDDAIMARSQSKASDHEGLLSDPLTGLPSSSDVKSPIVADLNLSLPSIPEVASDDERLDEAGDVRKAEKPVHPEAGTSSLCLSPPCPEKADRKSGRAGGSVSEEDLDDFRPKTPKAAPSEQTAVLGILKPHLGKSSGVDKQLPGSGAGEEENLKGSGRPGPPFCTPLGSPVPSPSFSETFPAAHSFPSSPHSDSHHTTSHHIEESQKKSPDGSAGKIENFGKRKPLLQAWVSPSETHPVSAQPSARAGAAKHRLHPVKPMNTTTTKTTNSSLGTATIISENLINEGPMKKYDPSDPAFAYAQLTHDELIQLVLKQKETISKKEFQVRELEDYIDNLLVRVMEETPNILRIPAQLGKKAGKV